MTQVKAVLVLASSSFIATSTTTNTATTTSKLLSSLLDSIVSDNYDNDDVMISDIQKLINEVLSGTTAA